MASIQDMLSSLLKSAGNHEELLGAIPAIAGAVLLARNGQVGGPLGAGLATAGGLLSLNAANRPQKQLLVNKNTGQLEPWDPTQPLGKDLETQSMYEEEQKRKHPERKLQHLMVGGQEYSFDPMAADPTKAYTKIPGLTQPTAPTAKTITELWQTDPAKAKALMAEEERLKIAGRAPQKSEAQIRADSYARASGALSALSGAPISRFGVVGLNPTTGSVMPLANENDVGAGRTVPIARTDLRQYRQVQAADMALSALDQTIEGALPKDPGLRSAAGTTGRALTDIVNPAKLARFKVAQFLSADAVIRAVTQRGNQAQFKAAMNDIVGPHATVASAKQGIQTAREIVGGIKDSIVGTGTSALAGGASATLPTMMPPAEVEAPEPTSSDDDLLNEHDR